MLPRADWTSRISLLSSMWTSPFEPECTSAASAAPVAPVGGLALTLCAPNEMHRANAIEDYLQENVLQKEAGNAGKLQWLDVYGGKPHSTTGDGDAEYRRRQERQIAPR